ncbi:hypothetical protein ABL_03885 [Aspergillus niger]|uniref:Uncharacterized protein n=1 Tax=Aspergillus niger TaxID=5061 RepID=A0A100IGN9_ASPNG|nr:hypothetical protein ABL_03885 [Aspergillus niger]
MTPTMPVNCAQEMTRRINRLEASDSLLTTASKAASAASAGVRWWGWLHGGILGMGSITGGGIGAGLRGQRRLHLKLSQRVALRPPAQQHAKATGQSPCGAVCIIASGGAKSPRSGTPWRFRWGHSAAAPIISLELGSRCSYWLTWRNAVVVCVIIPKEARLADFAPKVGAKASLPGVL